MHPYKQVYFEGLGDCGFLIRMGPIRAYTDVCVTILGRLSIEVWVSLV